VADAVITFDVLGLPQPQGSMKSLGNRGGRTILTHSNGAALMPWRQVLASAALAARPDGWDLSRPVGLSLTFRFPRPAGHYRTNGTLKPAAPSAKLTKPDLDKLIRACGDAWAGIVYRGDQQIVSIAAAKRFIVGTEAPGLLATIIPLASYLHPQTEPATDRP
jgi:Holliday junction resolvase RusA-like endonuclease